ncbi:MAG: DUF4198 domain-containing protein [Pseudomonadota bacterium]|nr:DUF4198 domain-containing protein [Pseudomonadota bacterium]
MIRALTAAFALIAASSASAHSFWLEPESYDAQTDEAVLVEFKVGDLDKDGGPAINDWGLYWERVAALQSFSDKGAVDQQTAIRTTQSGETGTALLKLKGEGSHILAFASNPSFSDLEAARFDRYVAHEGLKAIAADRAAKAGKATSGTELYARRAKTIINVGDAYTDVSRPVGHTLEIVPLANPMELGASDDLRVRVLWRGEPLPEAKVFAYQIGDKTRKTGVYSTGSDGETSVSLVKGKEHLISVVWGEPAPNDVRADYFTIFASLTFARD